jgi:energy-coupling factor transporter ATP-binding protein EcfA2
MRFIRAIRIRDFRSLQKVDLADVDNIVPIAGPNGSGKSNLLRALSLFFNDEVENGVPVDLARDFHDPELKRKTKKVVEVELDIDFGQGLRADLQQPITKLAGGSQIVTIRKTWSLDKITRTPTVDLGFGAAGEDPKVVADEDRALVERLLASVRFRYISNHVHPTQLLRDEEDNIRRGLFRRLGKSPSFSTDQIEKIREAAGSLMGPVRDELKGSAARVSDVELGTPKDWGELLWAFGLRMQIAGGVGREAVLHGSGVQSILAYAVLQMLDTSLGSDFGWRRGAIWAVEEPESFLHADLQAQLAESLSRYSNSDRLQILFTTHNTAFLGVAEKGVAVGMPAATSEAASIPRARLIDIALASGVTPYTHPLHVGPPKPVLLVEGKDDREVILRAYDASGQPCPYVIKAMEDLEPTTSGGVEQIQTYLGSNASALRARPTDSPVIVLLDHDVSEGKRGKIQKALRGHPTSGCYLLPKAERTSGLKDDMPGIEAYLSLDFYRAAEETIGLTVVRPGDPHTAGWDLGVEKSELGAKKQAIHRLLADRDDPADIAAVTALVPWVSKLLTVGGQASLSV